MKKKFIKKGNYKGNHYEDNKRKLLYDDKNFDKIKKKLGNLNDLISDTKTEEYSITVNGKKMDIEYEEMVEILAAMQDCSIGNECFAEAKIKSNFLFDILPVTDY
jgi:hypothetical protein